MTVQPYLAMVDEPNHVWLQHVLSGMTERTREAAAVYLSLPVRSLKESAQVTGHNYDMVRQWSSKYDWPRIASQYDEWRQRDLMAGIRGGIARNAAKAMVRMVELMDCGQAATEYRASAYVLGLAGLTPRTPVAVGEDGDTMTPIPIGDLFKLARSGKEEDLMQLVQMVTGQRSLAALSPTQDTDTPDTDSTDPDSPLPPYGGA